MEDNASFRDVIKEKIRVSFPAMTIYEAADGKDALEKVEALKPEIIFMDIRLPGENGLQLTQKITKKYPNTKVIILTSYDCPEYRQAAFQSGGICYLRKDSLIYVEFEQLIRSLVP